jgi:hypothetical protein
MPMQIKNLWGEMPQPEEIRTPYTIIREQAALLEELTGGILQGRVRKVQEEDTKSFTYFLDILAPALDDFVFRVLMIRYEITLYPVAVKDFVNDMNDECDTEESFVEELEKILGSDEMKRVISGLMSQIKSESES